MLPLRSAINAAKKNNKTARQEHVRIGESGKTRTINVAVIPLKNLRERCFLVVFEDVERAGPSAATSRGKRRGVEPSSGHAHRAPRAAELRRVAALEAELAETREYLQLIQEAHEATNEELQASNEEVQSANEELQSINEELETSKEELESANEELTTVNEEMASRNTELSRLNSDLVNVQTSAHLPIVLLGRDLTIGASACRRRNSSTCWPLTWAGRSVRFATISTCPTSSRSSSRSSTVFARATARCRTRTAVGSLSACGRT